MARQIVFRGKRIDNGEWVYGCVLKDYITGQYFIHACGNSVYESDKTGEEGLLRFVAYEVDPETVCQYTGLNDKNGRKIFEGDAVRDVFNASVVGIVRYGKYRNTFNDDGFGGHVGFYIEWKEKQDLLRKDLVYWVKNSEFIGNIFDNPKLVEE